MTKKQLTQATLQANKVLGPAFKGKEPVNNLPEIVKHVRSQCYYEPERYGNVSD